MRAYPITVLRAPIAFGARPDEDFFLAGPHSEAKQRVVDRDRRGALLADIRRQPRRGRHSAALSARG